MSRTRATGAEAMETAYGFSTVTGREEKQARVNEVFHRVAERYDLMNDLMSGGLHRLWKGAMVSWLAPPHRAGWRFIDVAGGTGDVAFRIVEASRRSASGTVLDINASMLGVGAERAVKRGLQDNLVFVEGNAEKLALPDASFDAYTIAFGIRNVPRIDLALAEAYRVLKPGGRFLCLEFSEVDMPVLDKVYEAWSFKAIPRIGEVVARDRESYEYLVESIRRFPNQENFAAAIRAAGFERVTYRNLSGGIAAIHSGWKL
ncbi:bifunctional demethylmenaquinone methyltransferase/2-methoxy-6-polyprenyl-1,4-benzoquinol methylase UbiE [Aurantimonas endophytica]|uniref:Ubiquinone/menaquinone biosynthesis C-methyltransferase UbiE n=1 Tax=Aurantimonas endophytica TaxID=1522175 RepID=A0A7W6HI42_9HYPH|nr:bifunctional demethylmenaquinone methyltransferase/2-methoxy-6-polyprenyl-1,4-benzoquinol methylase UbiE [Aurantimonas endophytica]MBB4005356.1 demethylmenaquinone methyltransferase/2-methoxy-6-polyprenyl-1,4-benzoquinol methylase [Aurantimonas endophytica]MCO6405983.1 bifunctional demethylmenaquinone methyltransferase/2-methoxy-6-polyprenyl-1,4-benzoquinol methylase UbiE [Aurantimonas endophytica]